MQHPPCGLDILCFTAAFRRTSFAIVGSLTIAFWAELLDAAENAPIDQTSAPSSTSNDSEFIEAITVRETSIILRKSVSREDLIVSVGGRVLTQTSTLTLNSGDLPVSIYVNHCNTDLTGVTRGLGMLQALAPQLSAFGPTTVWSAGASLVQLAAPATTPERIVWLINDLVGFTPKLCSASAGDSAILANAIDKLPLQDPHRLVFLLGFFENELYNPSLKELSQTISARGLIPVIIAPSATSQPLESTDVRPSIMDPDPKPPVFNLNNFLVWLFSREKDTRLKNDPRIYDHALDPRYQTMRAFIGPTDGRIVNHHEQLENFVASLQQATVVHFSLPEGLPLDTPLPLRVIDARRGRDVSRRKWLAVLR